MASELTVYGKMTSSASALSAVVRQEIGVKACIPFSAKACDALASLGKLTEAESRKAANTFLSNLQTLTQGGIITEDYDKIDFVKRGNEICISARVEAFIRAAKRKGYRIIDTIVPVPKADTATTYFEENFYNGEILYVLKDLRKTGDRKITAKRLIDGYFDKFICRLDIYDARTNKRLLMTACEMSNEEVVAASRSSDKGIFKSQWIEYTDNFGKKRKKKEITNVIDPTSNWVVWVSDMVAKTVIRRALKRVREALPELNETILAFETAERTDEGFTTESNIVNSEDIEVEAIPMPNVNIFELTENQQAEAKEMKEIYKANPKLAKEHAEEIKKQFEDGKPVQEICNEHYASIIPISMSKNTHPIIEAFLSAARAELIGGDSDEE